MADPRPGRRREARRGTPRRWSARAGGWAAAMLGALVACQPRTFEPDDVCEDVAASVSNRTFACTRDVKLANDRYHQLRSRYRCTADPLTPFEEVYDCPIAVGELSCEQVAAAGEDYDKWLSASPRCPEILKKEGAP